MRGLPPLLTLLWAAALAQTGLAPLLADELADQIEAITLAAPFEQANWGVLVADLKTGEVLYEHAADKLYMPASTTKLYTTAAALDALGPDYRFHTPIYRTGELATDGTLEGDLVLVASGDPTLGGRTTADGQIAFTNSDHTYADGGPSATLTEPDPLAGLDELARQIHAAGVRRMRGELLIDDRLFVPSESTGSGPRRVCPIMVNDNLIDVVCSPGEPGMPGKVSWRPQTELYRVENELRTVPAGGETRIELETRPRDDGPTLLVVRGQVAADAGDRVVVVEVADPIAWARGLLIEALRRQSIEVAAPLLASGPKPPLPPADHFTADRRLAEFVSPPFSEEVKLVLKVSHNLHASLLPLLVATRQGKRTLAEGLAAEGQFLATVGVEVRTISFGGGAGGSRADYTTPRATVALLRGMSARPDFATYRQALPVLGVDGTLHDAVPADSPARGRVQAKTGTFYWRNDLQGRWLLLSKALAGYLTARSGRELAFSLVVNNVHLDRADDRTKIGQVLGRLCELVYESQ